MILYYNQYFLDRDVDNKGYEKYVEEYKEILNIETLPLFITHFKKLYTHENYNYFLKYILSLLKEWIMTNEYFSYAFLNKLKKIISWYKLENKLNNVEISYIQELESIIFNKNRNIKNITTEFTLYKDKKKFFLRKEEIYYYFDNVNVKFSNDQSFSEIILLITTNHLVFLNNSNFIKIKFDDIKEYKLKLPKEIILVYKDIDINITSNEIKTIYVSFERVFYGK